MVSPTMFATGTTLLFSKWIRNVLLHEPPSPIPSSSSFSPTSSPCSSGSSYSCGTSSFSGVSGCSSSELDSPSVIPGLPSRVDLSHCVHDSAFSSLGQRHTSHVHSSILVMMLGWDEGKVCKMPCVTVRVHVCGYLDGTVHARELFTLLAQCSLLGVRGYCVSALALLVRYKGFEGRCASMEWNNLDANVASEKCTLLSSEFVFLIPKKRSCLDVWNASERHRTSARSW